MGLDSPECESQVSNSKWEGYMRKTDSHSSEVQLSELLACAQPDVLGLRWIVPQSIWWHPGHQGTRGQGHCLNDSHGIRCQTVQLGLDIISVQLTQQSTVSKERTKLGLVQVSWATSRVGVQCPSPFSLYTFHISVFFHPLFTCHWISFVFLLYDRRICTHSIDPSLADGEFPGLGLALVPEVVVPGAEPGVRMKQKSRFKFLPWPGFEPRT